jgi:succinate dehydrogenase / fumarate reductase cytochrome b subunit
VSQAATPSGQPTPSPIHFLLRRLHSLAGIVPVGVFLFFHLFTNMQMLVGDFQHEVEFIHNMPALLFIEIFGLWLPIAFHAILGVWYTVSGKSNVVKYKYADNWRYTLQRVTGIIAFIFIFLHIATLRWGWQIFGWYTPFFVTGVAPTGTGDGAEGLVVPLSHLSTHVAVLHPLLLAMYVISMASIVFHLANGLWTAAITWGVTITPRGQKQWGYACAAIGLALAGAGGAAILGAVIYDAPEKEDKAYKYMVEMYRDGVKLDLHGADKGEFIELTAEQIKFIKPEMVYNPAKKAEEKLDETQADAG